MNMVNRARAVCLCAALVLTAGAVSAVTHALSHTSASPLSACIWGAAALVSAASLLLTTKRLKEDRD